MAAKNISGQNYIRGMKIRQAIIHYLPVLGVIFFIIFGINGLLRYYHYRTLEFRNRQLESAIQTIDAIPDDREAVNRYKALSPHIPEVDLRILQRQWIIALGIIHQIQLARNNEELEQDTPRFMNELKDQLDGMRDKCNSILSEKESLSGDIVWRVYNLSGAVKLLTAFLVLENEKNIEKVQGLLREAVSDLKSSIAAVDTIPGSMLVENIPRWNLELLTAQQYIRKFEVSKLEEAAHLDLSNNLEVLIPERGGYAPGEPLERRVKK
jgi:hypothetical protein